MNLVDFVQSKGFPLAKQSSGGEWAGPCPFCGGNDRFRVFEDGGRAGAAIPGRYFCRQCGAKGDYVSWLIDFENLSPAEALTSAGCSRAGQKADKGRKCAKMSTNHARNSETNRNKGETVSAVSASETWSGQAERVLSSAMQSMTADSAGAFFHGERGLSFETCKALGFGWQTSNSFTAAELWGLPAGKKVVVPAGAVLPVHRSGRVVSLLVRRSTPYRVPGTDRELRFHEVRGGAKVPFLCGPFGAPLVVCESILCAASVYQASGGKVAALATLGASKPILDAEAVDFLKSAAVVLVAADDDEAGGNLKEIVRQVCPDAFAYAVPMGEAGEPFRKSNGKAAKDINDLLQVWRDDARLFGWLAQGFCMAERARLVPPQNSSSAMPEREDSGAWTGYNAFCPRYWQGCGGCSDYLPPNTDEAKACGPFFCRKANRLRFGSELVCVGEGAGRTLGKVEKKTSPPGARLGGQAKEGERCLVAL